MGWGLIVLFLEMSVWSACFMSHVLLLETIKPRNGNNLRKSEKSHAIFAYELLGTDILALDEMIRVSHIIGYDMSLCSLGTIQKFPYLLNLPSLSKGYNNLNCRAILTKQ